MLTCCAYVDTNFPCTFQYYMVLKLKSCTLLCPLTFNSPITSLDGQCPNSCSVVLSRSTYFLETSLQLRTALLIKMHVVVS